MMHLNVPMLKRYTRRLFSGPVDLYSLASKSWEIHPEESFLLPKAIFLDSTLDKIKSLSPWRNWEAENSLIHGGRVTRRPTQAYTIDNIDLVESFIYASSYSHQVGYEKENLFLSKRYECEKMAKANLVTTWSGCLFFGSYLLDDYPIELIPEDPENNIRIATKPYHHDSEYRRLVGLAETPVLRSAQIGSLTVFEDASHSTYRAQRYRQLRERFYEQVKTDVEVSEKYIFLKRSDDGEPRVLGNSESVEQFLEEAGFDIIDPSLHSAREIAAKTIGAKIVVSVEGSQLSHAQYSMADGATLVVIQPPNRFCMMYKEFTDCLDMEFAFLVASEGTGGEFLVDLDELQQLLDLCGKRQMV